MKKETGKTNRRWLWLVIAPAIALVVAGVLIAVFLGKVGSEDQPETAGYPDIYWNVDGDNYLDPNMPGVSTRGAAKDGLFYIRFAVGGEQVQLPVADKHLVNSIDNMHAVCLTQDESGVIIDAVDAKEVVKELARQFVVQRIEADAITLNSSPAFNGLPVEIPVTDGMGIYDVSTTDESAGQVTQLAIMDEVTVYGENTEIATHVFVTSRPAESEVYWRVDRWYNTATKQTTREPDENGDYSILFACNGQQLSLKCKDKDVVTLIDSWAADNGGMGLIFDAQGYIIDVLDINVALRGRQECYLFDITELNGSQFTATSLITTTTAGKTFSGVVGENCRIFNVSGAAEMIGEPADALQLGDRITAYVDANGELTLIFINNRMVDSPLYFNLTRQYSTPMGSTTRAVNDQGYYVYDLVVNGKAVTLKTKDKALADKLDKPAARGVGLKVNGDIIERVYDIQCVTGRAPLVVSQHISGIMGTVYTATTYTTGVQNSFLVDADCKIYDVTGYPDVKLGMQTTLRQGDKIVVFRDPENRSLEIYITERMVDAKIYWNVGRKYSVAQKSTTRQPDAEGYYCFQVVPVGGKEITVKTKSKTLASYIDQQNAPMVAMRVSGGIIKAAYPATAAIEGGGKGASFGYIDSVDGKAFVSHPASTGIPENYTMSADCKIYNMSEAFDQYRGELTQLKINDRVQGITGTDGTIQILFVMEREVDSPLYWNRNRMYDSTKKETTRQTDANGWYIFDLAVNGKVKQFKTKDKDIATKIDSNSAAVALKLKGDQILQVYSAETAKGIYGVYGQYDIMKLSGRNVTITRNLPSASNRGTTYEKVFASNCKYYDVSPYAEVFAGEKKAQVGDRVTCYVNEDGEIVQCFIVSRNTRSAGSVSLCKHCGKEVFWNPWDGTSLARADAHYYLTYDATSTVQGTVGNDTAVYDVVIDLNGHTLQTPGRGFLVQKGSTLTILDTVGGGAVCSIGSGHGAAVMVSSGGIFNLYAGTLTQAKDAVEIARGGVIYISGKDSTVNIHGGAVTGGKVTPTGDYAAGNGGNIYVSGGKLNILGGTVSDGILLTEGDVVGNNVYAAAGSVFTVTGGKITGDVICEPGVAVTLSGSPVITAGGRTGLEIASGETVTLGAMSGNAQVCISGSGVFTGKLQNAKSYIEKGYIKPANPELDLTVLDGALAFGKTGYCAHCEKRVFWGAWNGSAFANVDAHYYMAYDIQASAQRTIGADSVCDIVLDLNGHTLQTAARGFLVQKTSTFSILDSIGGGVVRSVGSGHGAAVMASTGGVFNLYGGTLTQAENAVAIARGGVIYISGAASTVNIYGGTVTGGAVAPTEDIAVCSGGNIYVSGGVLNVLGGTVSDGKLSAANGVAENIYASGGAQIRFADCTVTGGVYAEQEVKVAVSGAPVISGTGIKLSEGVKITLDELTEKASIVVSADGVFTEANDNIEVYKTYFIPAAQEDSITVQDKALVYQLPEKDVNLNLVFEPGTTVAECPICEQKVQWKAVSGETAITMDNGDHYYLPGDVTYNGTEKDAFLSGPGTNKKACLHLNGHNLSATAHRAIFGSAGELNIMGNGTVSGYMETANHGAALHINTSGAKGALNLYGGTYQNLGTDTQSATATIWNNGGKIYVYKGAKLQGDIYVGTANLTDGVVGVYGGVVEGGSIRFAGANTQKGNSCLLDVTGGNIQSDVQLALNTKISLSGAPVVKTLSLAEGVKITLGELTEGAQITVSAAGVFTVPCDNAEAYWAYFIPVVERDSITVKENALYYEVAEPDVNLDLVFEPGTTVAECPICEQKVQWKAVSGETAITMDNGDHYYLPGDVTYNGTEKDAFLSGPGTNKKACLHLNGHNLSATAHRAIFGSAGELNIMGNGVVAGYVETANHGAALHINTSGAKGALNLYGGTYQNLGTDTQSATATIWNNGGKIYVYRGAKLQGDIYVGTANLVDAVIGVYGGMVEGGSIRFVGANTKKGNSCLLDVTGGSVLSDVQIALNTKVNLSGAPEVKTLSLAEGVKITLGELTEGAQITVNAAGLFTETSDKAEDYAEYFTPADNACRIVPKDNALYCEETGPVALLRSAIRLLVLLNWKN